MVSDVRLESIYLVVGSAKLFAAGSKLICKLLSGFSCLLKFCLSCTGSPADEPKNRISRSVQHVGRAGILRIRNSGFQPRRIGLLTRTYLKIV